MLLPSSAVCFSLYTVTVQNQWYSPTLPASCRRRRIGRCRL